MWRRKLGARTRKGQPVMQHIIDKTLMQIQQQHLSERDSTVKNPFSLTDKKKGYKRKVES
jgi:hypothetical protein